MFYEILSLCPADCNGCYVIVLLASLRISFFSSRKPSRPCVNLPHSEYYNAVAVSIERFLASVCLENNLSCSCVYVGSERHGKLWKLCGVRTRDCVSGLPGQVVWNPALRGGGWKITFPEPHLLCMYHICPAERWYLLRHCISCGCAVTGIKSSAFNAKGSEIFLKLISCPMQVFSTTCITSTL